MEDERNRGEGEGQGQPRLGQAAERFDSDITRAERRGKINAFFGAKKIFTPRSEAAQQCGDDGGQVGEDGEDDVVDGDDPGARDQSVEVKGDVRDAGGGDGPDGEEDEGATVNSGVVHLGALGSPPVSKSYFQVTSRFHQP